MWCFCIYTWFYKNPIIPNLFSLVIYKACCISMVTFALILMFILSSKLTSIILLLFILQKAGFPYFYVYNIQPCSFICMMGLNPGRFRWQLGALTTRLDHAHHAGFLLQLWKTVPLIKFTQIYPAASIFWRCVGSEDRRTSSKCDFLKTWSFCSFQTLISEVSGWKKQKDSSHTYIKHLRPSSPPQRSNSYKN